MPTDVKFIKYKSLKYLPDNKNIIVIKLDIVVINYLDSVTQFRLLSYVIKNIK